MVGWEQLSLSRLGFKERSYLVSGSLENEFHCV